MTDDLEYVVEMEDLRGRLLNAEAERDEALQLLASARLDCGRHASRVEDLESVLRKMQGEKCYDEYGFPTDHRALVDECLKGDE
jgi:hypothetical protein